MFTSTPSHGLFFIDGLFWSANARQNLPMASSKKDRNAHDLKQVLSSYHLLLSQIRCNSSCPVMTPLCDWQSGVLEAKCFMTAECLKWNHCSQGTRNSLIKDLLQLKLMFQILNIKRHWRNGSTNNKQDYLSNSSYPPPAFQCGIIVCCFKDNRINKTKSNMFLFLLVLASFEAPGLFCDCLRWWALALAIWCMKKTCPFQTSL